MRNTKTSVIPVILYSTLLYISAKFFPYCERCVLSLPAPSHTGSLDDRQRGKAHVQRALYCKWSQLYPVPQRPHTITFHMLVSAIKLNSKCGPFLSIGILNQQMDAFFSLLVYVSSATSNSEVRTQLLLYVNRDQEKKKKKRFCNF